MIALISTKLEMDLKNEVNTLEELGMSDPICPEESLKVAESVIKNLNFFYDMYPKEVMDKVKERIEYGYDMDPPKCIFVPSKDVMRTIIKGLLKFGHIEEEKLMLARLGLSFKL